MATRSGAYTSSATANGTTGATTATGSDAVRTLKVQAFRVPTAASGLADLAAGPDGALWFTEQSANKVGRITTKGRFTQYRIPNNAGGLDSTGPTSIVKSGPAMWFLTDIGQSVYRITPGGTHKLLYSNETYPVADLAPGTSGGAWLMMRYGDSTAPNGDTVILLNRTGKGTSYPANHSNVLYTIALGPGGTAWYNNEGESLNTISAAGQEHSHPVTAEAVDEISSIAFTRSGTAYYTAYAPQYQTVPGCCGVVGTLTRAGTSRFTALSAPGSGVDLLPYSLVTGRGGYLWFAASSGGTHGFSGIGRINPGTGKITLASTGRYTPTAMAFGKDGALWFADSSRNIIGRIPRKELSI